jgi:hypothetical protein
VAGTDQPRGGLPRAQTQEIAKLFSEGSVVHFFVQTGQHNRPPSRGDPTDV